MKKRPIWTDRMPRWWNHCYAILGGYFWKPCHRCGAWFGGHEMRPPPEGGYLYRTLMTDLVSSDPIPCPDCDASDYCTYDEIIELMKGLK